MQTFRVDDGQGHTLTLEGDSPPTEQELEEIFSKVHGPDAVTSYSPQATLPGGFMDPGDVREGDFTKALFSDLPADINTGIHKVMDPVERMASAAVNVFGLRLTEPGHSVIPGLEPEPTDVGVIPSARRAAAGFTTPGTLVTLPFAAESKLLQAGFMGGAAASIPPSVQALADAQTGAEARGALTDIAISGAIAGGIGKSLTRERNPNARRVQSPATLYGDVYKDPFESTQKVPTEEGSAGVQPSNAQRQGPQTQVSLENGISDLQKDPEATGQRFVGFDANGKPRYEQNATNARKAQELADLKAKLELKQRQSTLSPEEQAYIDAERQAIDTPIEVVTEQREGDPFARNKRARAIGQFMGINRRTRTIEIYPEEFKKWLAGVPENLRGVAVKARLWEERIHLATDSAAARAYWAALTRAEKLINEYRYSKRIGKARERLGISDTDMGHEALRFRMQQLADMTPSEIAETVGAEQWTLKGLTVLETAIRGVREHLLQTGKVTEEQRGYLDKIQNNLNLAKTVASGSSPGAVRRDTGEPDLERVSDDPQDVVDAAEGALFSLRSRRPADADEASMLAGQLQGFIEDKTGRMYDQSRMNDLTSPRYIEAHDALVDVSHQLDSLMEQWAIGEQGPAAIRRQKAAEYKGEEMFSPDLLRASSGFAKAHAAASGDERVVSEADKQLYKDAERIGQERGPAAIRRGELFDDSDYKPKPTTWRGPYAEDETGVTIEQFRKGAKDASAIERALNDSDFSITDLMGHDVHPSLWDRDLLHSRSEKFLYKELQQRHGMEYDEAYDIINNYKESGRKAIYDADPALGSFADTFFYPEFSQLGFKGFKAPESRRAGDQQERGPAAIRRGMSKADERKIEQHRKLMALRQGVEAGTAIPATQHTAELHYTPATPQALDAAAAKVMSSERPSYNDFASYVRMHHGDFEPGALHDLWMDKLNTQLNTMSGKKLEDLINQLQLRREVLGSVKNRGVPRADYATLSIADPATTGDVGLEEYRATQLEKATRMSALANKLLAEADNIQRRGAQRRSAEPERVAGSSLFPAAEMAKADQSLDAANAKKLRDRAAGMKQLSEQMEREARAATEVPAAARQEFQEGLGLVMPEQPKSSEREVSKEEPEVRLARRLAKHPLSGRAVSQKGQARGVELNTPAVKMRAKAITAIFRKLSRESLAPRKSLTRTDIATDDLRWSEGDTAYQAVPADLDPVLTAQMLVKGAGTERSTKVPISGGKAVQRRSALPESATKRLTTVLDTLTKKVYQLSTYRHGRKGVVMLDPVALGNQHRPLESMMSRYKPLFSSLLDSPVQNFRREFENLDAYNEQFGNDAKARSEQVGFGEAGVGAPEDFTAEGTEGLEGQGAYLSGPEAGIARAEAGMVRGALESGAELTPAEARSAYQAFRNMERPQDADALIESLAKKAQANELKPADWLLINAIRKVSEASTAQPPESALDTLYGLAKKNESEQSFVSSTQKRYAPESAVAPEAEAAPTGQELTMANRVAPTMVRPEQVPPGSQPTRVSSTPRVEPREPVTKEQYQHVSRLMRKAARERRLIEEKYGKAGPSLEERTDILGGRGPAALNRRARVEDEYSKVRESIGAWATRRQTDDKIASTRDAADNIAHTFADQARIDITMHSAGEKLKEGNPDKLRAANAVIASGALKPRYTLDLAVENELANRVEGSPGFKGAMKLLRSRSVNKSEQGRAWMNTIRGKVINEMLNEGKITHSGVTYEFREAAKDKLDGFLAQVNRGIVKAEASMRRGRSMQERRVGWKMARAGYELKSELELAKAQWNDPELRATAEQMMRELDQQYDREVEAGYDIRRDDNYMPGRYDAEFFSDNTVKFGPLRMLGRKWRAPKTFDNYYDAYEKSDPVTGQAYLPLTRNGADIVSHRIRQGMRQINKKAWAESLKGMRDPDSGRPVAIDAVKKGEVYVSPDPNYEIKDVFKGGKPIAVRRGFERIYDQMTKPSAIQENVVSAAMLDFGQKLKHTILLGDFFHLGRVGYYGAAIMGKRIGWKGGLTPLEMREGNLDEAVRRGVIRQKDADWARDKVNVKRGDRTIPVSRIDLAQKFQQHGLNTGRISDAIYKDLAGNIPFLGKYNKFLFDKLTRGLMMQSALTEFERLNAVRPDIDHRVLMRDIAKDVNAFYGSLGRQGAIKSATFQDLARLAYLAPQWVEGLARKELGFYGRVTGLSNLTGRTGVPQLGTLGKGMGRGLVAMLALTQVLNLISRKKPTWKNDEEGHKFDAWIPDVTGKTEGFFLSPLSLFNELSHDVVRYAETKPTMFDAFAQIGENKLGPWGRVIKVLGTRMTGRGERITTTAGVAGNVLQQLNPTPISVGSFAQAGAHAVAPGLVTAPQRGVMQRQLVGSLGIKIEPAQSPSTRVLTMAEDFVKHEGLKKETGWESTQTDEASYTKLRSALRNGDPQQARSVFQQLLNTHSEADINKAMKMWLVRPFTGSRANEKQFLFSLDDKGLDLYNRAKDEKQELYNAYLNWYINQP